MVNNELDCDVIVVGAGLSGLTCASLLLKSGLSTIVLEAADRIGGRIHSLTDNSNGLYTADLGPTWVWPQYQPIVQMWLDRLGVETFDQFEQGDGIYDFGEDTPVHRQIIPAQQGIRRICGGPQALIDALLAQLPPRTVRTRHCVRKIIMNKNSVSVSISNPAAATIRAHRIVVAMPLRSAAQMISWSDCLNPDVVKIMKQTPTWMASQAKAIITFERPFWRLNGLSGRVASQAGPLMEVHDHCRSDGRHAALFGFVGWPHTMRHGRTKQLQEHIIDQLVRCFGREAKAYNTLHIEDWAANPLICSTLDLASPPSHPVVIPDMMRAPHYKGRLFFAVAETALQSPGLIEGALDAANATATRLTALHRQK